MIGSLFAEPRPLANRLAALAQRGIYIGTSSWKYEGWLGSIYTPSRYETRGKFSQKKFDESEGTRVKAQLATGIRRVTLCSNLEFILC